MTPRDFLEALFGTMDKGYLLIWTKALDGKQTSHWFRTPSAAAKMVESLTPDCGMDVYFGLGIDPTNHGPFRRGTSTGKTAIPALWLDIDLLSDHAHSKTDLPGSEAEALALLKEFPFKPSLVVHSGNGLHVYWIFKEVWEFDSGEEQHDAMQLVRSMVRWFQTRARAKGWDCVDSTTSLAQVLRVPGTWNFKAVSAGISAKPKDVTILSSSGQRYNPSDFDELALSDFFPTDGDTGPVDPTTSYEWSTPDNSTRELTLEQARKARLNLSQNNNPLGIKLPPKGQVPSIEYAQVMILEEEDPNFKATWNSSNAALPDQSQSSYDMSLASILVSHGLSPQKVADLMCARRLRSATSDKDKTKSYRIDYYSRTILTALIGHLEYEAKQAASGSDTLDEQTVKENWSQVAKDKKAEEDKAKRAIERREKAEASRVAKLAEVVASQEMSNDLNGVSHGDPGDGSDTEGGGADADGLGAGSAAQARQELLDMVSDKLRIKVLKVVRYMSDPPTFAIHTMVGMVPLGTVENLITLDRLRKHISAYTLHLPPAKINKWGAYAQALLKASQTIDPGEDSRSDGETRRWVREFLESHPPHTDKDACLDANEPWVTSDPGGNPLIYLHLGKLRSFLGKRESIRVPMQTLATNLINIGCSHEKINYYRQDGQRTTRRMYSLPKDICAEFGKK